MEQFTVREYIVREMGFRGVLKQEIVGEIVRCKDCKHRQYEDEDGDVWAPNWVDFTCPYLCENGYYNGMPEDDFFCKRGERREDVEETD